MVEDDGLFSVGSDALTERLLAGKPVIESGDAAFVRDDPASHALDSGAENCESLVSSLFPTQYIPSPQPSHVNNESLVMVCQ